MISLAVAVVVIVLACSIFAIGEVRVVAATDTLLDEETTAGVIEAAGIKSGGSIFSVDEEAVISNVESAYPQIKVITVERSFPGTVSINCTLRSPWICVPAQGGFALLDRELKVLDVVGTAPTSGYTIVSGYTLSSSELGAFADIEWLKAIIEGGENNYFMDVKLSYFLTSIVYHGGEKPFIQAVTNTGASLLIYDEGAIGYMFSALYKRYLTMLFNEGGAAAEEGYFYPYVDADGSVGIGYSPTLPSGFSVNCAYAPRALIIL